MDNDWDQLEYQYVGDIDLDYNIKIGEADEGSSLSTIQIPTPPVSIA
jgi:hypothetical protein